MTLIIANKILEKSVCYDNYWQFAHNRQERLRSTVFHFEPPADDIIDRYKFTNCYRALDRTSQYLIKNILERGEYDEKDTFLRIMIFKVFNKIETWQALEDKVGSIDLSTFNEELYAKALESICAEDKKIYSAAYIMPSGKREFGSSKKHENNLRMISFMLKQKFQHKVWDTNSLEENYELLLSIPSIGKFLAYQYAIDIGYSRFSNTIENQFVVAGPGAARGIKKCFPNAKPEDFRYIIEYMTDNQTHEFARLGITFNHLRNRHLQLIDCQNLFCEIDKYLRVARPTFDKAGARIKQLYKKKPDPINYKLPLHWNSFLE
ncbi:nucleotide kinase domain-containing protein [Pseudomonas sp. MN1F]|uniref:nucleotide kinase domain-containing protein n=1 Tax=Pseudomonas sp. MN1F TaxID=1366632 RepID=UPI00128F29C8|nr:nucleotide kinase domain-containing protein [Pseudomonas sp. MN1F]MQG94143.1 hypothetical protein [Pseudomonas sp. MN1F]